MDRQERMRNYQKLHAKYRDLMWKPEFMPVLKIASPFVKRFSVRTEYEEQLPRDGGIIFPQNHSNFYDSLVFDVALKGEDYFCFASDEPRGGIQGLSFEAKGVVWVKRDSKESRTMASRALVDLLKCGENISWCPEGLWCLEDNKLLLRISRGMAKIAIEASRSNNVYIVPVVIDYDYDDKSRVKGASVKVCKSIKIEPSMKVDDLTGMIEDIFWTQRWLQLEEKAREDSRSVLVNFENQFCYVYPRGKESLEKWEKHIDKIKSQYPTDWEKEATYRIVTEEERLQKEMERYIRPNGESHVRSLMKVKKIK